MIDRDALLRAIATNPDDDTPRLMYADLMDELGGDANAARARFIRVQIDLARNAKTNWFANADRLCEVSYLAGQYADKWLDELPIWAAEEARKQRLRADDLPRGFLDTFHIHIPTFCKYGHHLLEVAPVTRLVVPGPLTHRDLSAVLLCPHLPFLGRVRSLVLDARGGEADVSALYAKNSHILGAIEELTVASAGLTDAGAKSLSEAIGLNNLRVLVARASQLTESGAASLLRAPLLPKLTSLDIRGAANGYQWAQRLRRGFPKKTVLV